MLVVETRRALATHLAEQDVQVEKFLQASEIPLLKMTVVLLLHFCEMKARPKARPKARLMPGRTDMAWCKQP
jgi:hypothetical protein